MDNEHQPQPPHPEHSFNTFASSSAEASISPEPLSQPTVSVSPTFGPPSPPPAPTFSAAPPPPPFDSFPAATEQPPDPTDMLSQPVVRVLSPRGVEYVFLTVALFTAAIGLGSALISLVNGQTSFNVLSFPIASLLVALPVFAFLFLRLKKTELQNPSLKHEASKRRSTQFTQIASFLVSFFTLIGFVTAVLAKIAGEYHGSVVKLFLDVLITLLIAGGILFYYWRDEHRS